MEDSIFALFLGFSALWIVMGVGALLWFFRTENQNLKMGTQGLLVTLPILIPFLLALVYGAFKLQN